MPIQCRLSRPSLTDVVQYANAGTAQTPAQFCLKPAHSLPYAMSAIELFHHVHEMFPPYTIALVSRPLRESDHNCRFLGLADQDLLVALARGDTAARGKWRNVDLAQTLLHEAIHLTGRDHHRRTTYARDRLLCPFMYQSAPRETALSPCKRCTKRLVHFCETRAA